MAKSGFEKRFPARDSGAAKTLAANVRQLRKEKEWTQDDLAAEIGIEQGALSLIENGRANPTLLVLEAIANSFKYGSGSFSNLNRKRGAPETGRATSDKSPCIQFIRSLPQAGAKRCRPAPELPSASVRLREAATRYVPVNQGARGLALSASRACALTPDIPRV